MAKLQKAPETDELQILLPEEEITLPDSRRLILRPWNLAQFGKAAAVLMAMIEELTPLGLTFDNAEEFLRRRWVEFLPLVLPHFPPLIGLTLPDIDLAGVDAGTQAAVGLRILLLNGDSLKNFLTLALGSGAKAGAILS
jgi:hypothetical protein